MEINDFEKKNVLILGFGKEGQDSFLFLRKLFPKKILGIADQKETFTADNPKFLKLIKKDKRTKWHLGKNYLKALKSYKIIIKSPGVPIHLPEIEKAFRQGKITSQTEIFFENCPGKIVGITGTKGKGTTASLIYKILKQGNFKAFLIGNIGKPVLEYLFSATKKKIYVYELSGQQLYRLKKSPQIAVLLNISQAHLDFFKDFNEYVKSKINIVKHQTKKDFLVYNPRDRLVKKIAGQSKAEKIAVSIKSRLIGKIKNKIRLAGRFNLENAAAAAAVGKIFGISEKNILKAIQNFKPLPHRLEFVGSFKGIEFYNDSLATVPEATRQALETLGYNVQTIFLGGSETNVNYGNLAGKILKSKIKNIILFPSSGEKIRREIEKRNKKNKTFNFFRCSTMREAVEFSYKKTEKRKICLLSCASPSFGIFKNYKERGNLYKKYVKKYAKQH